MELRLLSVVTRSTVSVRFCPCIHADTRNFRFFLLLAAYSYLYPVFILALCSEFSTGRAFELKLLVRLKCTFMVFPAYLPGISKNVQSRGLESFLLCRFCLNRTSRSTAFIFHNERTDIGERMRLVNVNVLVSLCFTKNFS